ncbi:MAG: abortive infection protein [Opitutus sp.]
MNRRGINYDVGIVFSKEYMSRPALDLKIVQRELQIIKDDLHCTAVRISGTEIDRLIAAAEIASALGLEVWLSPHLHDNSAEDTLRYMLECGRRAEAVRQRWPGLILIIGCELTLFMNGILKGDTFIERISNPLTMLKLKVAGSHNRPLNAFLTRAAAAVREVFHGPITYASAPIEEVNWAPFDFVCVDYYRGEKNRDTYAARLRRHFAHDKPVIVTEVGCCAYRGAEDKGAMAWAILDSKDLTQLNGDYIRDEALQARELRDMLGILQREGVEGIFVFTFVAPALPHEADARRDRDLASYAIVKSYANGFGVTYPEMPWEPKAAFHAVAEIFSGDARSTTPAGDA